MQKVPPLMPKAKATDLTVHVEQSMSAGDYTVIDFIGELDKFGLDKVKDQLDSLIDTFDKQSLVFNFARLDFINSESIGFLLTVHAHLLKKNKKLVLVNAPTNVKDVLDVIGMFKIIGYYDSVAHFEQSLKK